MALGSPIEKIRIRNADLADVRHGFVQYHQARGVSIRKRLQKRGIYYGKYRSICSDSKCERKHSNSREARRFSQLTQSEAKILLQAFEDWQTFFLGVSFSNYLDGSELHQCLATRFLQRHAQPNILFGLQSHMLLEFFAQTLVASTSRYEVPKTQEKAIQSSHVRSSRLKAKKRAMMVVVCSQFSVSARSCFWPLRVNR